MVTAPDFQVQDRIYQLVQDRPELRRYLAEMVAWETDHPPNKMYASGWEWADVHTPTGIVNMLVGNALVDQVSKTRKQTEYRLHSLEDTAAGLDMDAAAGPDADPIDPSDLFDMVVGHDKVKALIRYAVGATKPVHVLLMGPPGTAKTLMLHDISRLPGSHFYVGSTTTKAGLVGLLLQEKPKFLVIDELDKTSPGDLSPLLNLMETGLVTRLQHGRRDRLEMDTRVFAGANDIRRLEQASPALLSRFAVFDIPPYSPIQFTEVARQVLQKREGCGEQMATLIATEVVNYSTDIRDAVRVGRMAAGNPMLVMDVIKCLWPNGRRQTMQRR